ncbi:hypothetical protein FACS189459_5200 [Bacilli bacterium]|nr:hypothetical protein FACS189459_5200 [Bacilli bacterium]
MVANEKPLNIIPFDKIRYVKDIENYYICFYCQDKEFNSVINNPQKYLSIFKRCKGLIGFDYSIHTDFPITLQKFLMFSNLSLTYYYGFNNIKVIPNIRYGLDETADEFLKAIPKNQLISIGTYGFCKTNEEKKR